MNQKKKIVLKNGTEIEIENGALENCVQVLCANFRDIESRYEEFTEANLEEYKLLNADGLTCATLKNKYLKNMLVVPIESGYFIVSFILNDVDMVNKRLSKLEESQDIQDGAIGDLGTMVSDLANGGE